jgi:hypothetical protein
MTDTQRAEYESVIQKLTTALEQLAAENARLRAEKSDALSVCQEVYSDPTAPAALRIKAAGLALPHEVPRLAPVEAPLNLVAEEIVEPLAVVVERQRARMDRILALPLKERSAMFDSRNDDGSGGDDDTAS